MTPGQPQHSTQLAYTLLCDDIRLEAGNKLSLMGVFQNIYFHTLPATLLKFALLNHWTGSGEHTTEIKIISPDRTKLMLQTAPSTFSLDPGGFADNVTFFTNVVFAEEGPHLIQIYLNQIMRKEVAFNVVIPAAPNASVN
jgi:hypothetical protein